MKKKIIFLIVLIIAVFIFFLWENNSKNKNKNYITLYGNVDIREVNLSFRISGLIKTMKPEEGEAVSKGEAIAFIDRSQYEDQLQQAIATSNAQNATLNELLAGTRPEEVAQAQSVVAEREASLANAEQIFERNRRGFQAGVSTRQDYESSLQQRDEAAARLQSARESLREALNGPRPEEIEAARANLKASQAQIANLQKTVSYSTLTAPSDGVILTRIKEPGAYVNAGEPVYSLALSSPKWVQTYAGETELGKLRPGMSAEITNDTFPDKIYYGKIGFISPTAEFTPKSVETPELRTSLVYRVRLVVKDPKNELRQGMPVTVRFKVQ
jgi:HlyD family secretion protein